MRSSCSAIRDSRTCPSDRATCSLADDPRHRRWHRLGARAQRQLAAARDAGDSRLAAYFLGVMQEAADHAIADIRAGA